MKKIIYYSFLLAILFTSFPLSSLERYADNVVNIYVTRQAYDYKAPWQKLPIENETITGTVINENIILTLSYKLADQVLLEVSKFGSNKKYPAEVILKDYLCGLALIKVDDKAFFNDLNPVKLNENTVKSGKATALKWDNSGILKEFKAEFLKSSIEFFESSGAILVHHFISEINAAGKGEPVFINGRLAGITSWHYPKEKTIKIIDIQVIQRMLNDFSKSPYEGLPYFSIGNSALENDVYLREYLGLGKDDTGVLITELHPGTSGSDVLKNMDVILQINDTDIDDNGLFVSADYGQLNFYGLIYFNNNVGDVIKMKVFRDKKKIDVAFRLKPLLRDSYAIPVTNYDSSPEFYIIGGLVFQELTREYLKTWGKDWTAQADKRLMYYYDNFKRSPAGNRRRFVILNQVLPASVNKGYYDFTNLILEKVNNEIIKDLKHLREVIERSTDKYLVLDFVGEQRIVLDAAEAKASLKDIMNKYNINTAFYISED